MLVLERPSRHAVLGRALRPRCSSAARARSSAPPSGSPSPSDPRGPRRPTGEATRSTAATRPPSSTPATASSSSSSATATASPMRPRWRSPSSPARPTTRSSSTPRRVWARPTCCTRSATTCRAFGGGATVRYTTAEAFTNHFIAALGSKSLRAFKHAYRDADVLLIDDVQFLASKARPRRSSSTPSTPCTRPAASWCSPATGCRARWSAIEQRLRERFEAGLVADITPPDHATRRRDPPQARGARRRHRRRARGPRADRRPRHREHPRLEGALIRVVAFPSLTRRPIDLALATEVLDAMYPARATPRSAVDRPRSRRSSPATSSSPSSSSSRPAASAASPGPVRSPSISPAISPARRCRRSAQASAGATTRPCSTPASASPSGSSDDQHTADELATLGRDSSPINTPTATVDRLACRPGAQLLPLSAAIAHFSTASHSPYDF